MAIIDSFTFAPWKYSVKYRGGGDPYLSSQGRQVNLSNLITHYTLPTPSGVSIVPSAEEVLRILKGNQKAAQSLNPAHAYMTAWYRGHEAGGKFAPTGVTTAQSDHGEGPASVLTARRHLIDTILAASPEALAAL